MNSDGKSSPTEPVFVDKVKPTYVQRVWSFSTKGPENIADYTITHYSHTNPPCGWCLNQVGGSAKSPEQMRKLAKWILSVVGDEPDND